MGQTQEIPEGDRYYRAAGGVVLHDGRVLLVRKRHAPEVRLPKGHVEPGEDAETAALREVLEEAGYRGRAVADLGTRRVRFLKEGEWVSRDEAYFLMELADPLPQRRAAKETGKFDVFWAPADEAASLLTFESERDAVLRALAARR